jgi:hypothetical protein
VHKVQHKPRKKLSWGINKVWSKDFKWCCQRRTGQCPVCTGHCPVPQAEHHSNMPLSGFFMGRSAIIHRTVRYAPDMSGEPTEQQSVRATVDCKSEQCTDRSQSRKSKRTGHVRCATGLSGATTRQRTSMVNRSKPQRAADVTRTEH